MNYITFHYITLHYITISLSTTPCRILHRYYRPCCSRPPSIADDTGFIQPVLYDWPQLAEYRRLRLTDYSWMLSATPQQVRQA